MPIIGKHHVHPYSNAWALKDGCGGASGGRLGNRLVNQHLPHACFRRISPQRFLVSRFVAKTWPAFRSLWRESGTAAVASARENGQRPASRSPPGCSGGWSVQEVERPELAAVPDHAFP